MKKYTQKQKKFLSDWKKLERDLENGKINIKTATRRGMLLKKRFMLK